MIAKIFRWIALLIGGLAVVLIVFYLLLLAINWRDQIPSATVMEIHRAFEDRPAVPAQQNGYVYVTGFSAPTDSDPQKMGEEIVRKSPAGGMLMQFNGSGTIGERLDGLRTLSAVCDCASAQCLQSLQRNESYIADWVGARTLQLSRYAELKRRPQWQESVPSGTDFIFPPFGPVMDAQRLMLIGLWHRAPSMTSAEIRDSLQSDFRFWRLVLANADTLITKMIAVAGMRRHLAIGELVIRRLDANDQRLAIPDSWVQPLSREELSMLRVMKAEALYSESIILNTKGRVTFTNNLDSGEHSLGAWFGNTFLSPLFQPQDTVNKMAEYRIDVAKRYLIPLEQYPEVLRHSSAQSHTFIPHLYNPIGDVLHAIGESAYDRYVVRVGDLEGMRRAALLSVQLRSDGLDASAARERLQSANLKDPYTQAPFEWSESEQGIEFIGLEQGEHARQSYLY